MAVSKRLRYEILARDGHRCRYCGATAPDVKLVIDHVTPTALGGRDEPSNLVTACDPCNSGKTSTIPGAAVVADVADDAVRWAAAMKQAVAEMEAEEEPKLAYRQAFLDAWNEWTITWNGKEEPLPLPEDWRSSVERYRLAGIPATAWSDLIEPGAISRKVRPADVFRYTCGVANNYVAKLHERAKSLVSPQVAPRNPDATWDDAFRLVKEAAFAIWYSSMINGEDELPQETVTAFRESLAALTDEELTLEPGRIVDAAQFATYYGLSDIKTAIRDKDADRAWTAWNISWPTQYIPGDPNEPWSGTSIGGPTKEDSDRLQAQVDKLLEANVPMGRIEWAAAYAGFHKSAALYRGLTAQELEATGEHAQMCQIRELWRSGFTAPTSAVPASEDVDAFIRSIRPAMTGPDGDVRTYWYTDLFDAATTAATYQDTSIAASLPRFGSVFEAAAAIPPLPE